MWLPFVKGICFEDVLKSIPKPYNETYGKVPKDTMGYNKLYVHFCSRTSQMTLELCHEPCDSKASTQLNVSQAAWSSSTNLKKTSTRHANVNGVIGPPVKYNDVRQFAFASENVSWTSGNPMSFMQLITFLKKYILAPLIPFVIFLILRMDIQVNGSDNAWIN
jgi:hypothetical protein